jgi:hypothetical protein
MQIPGHGKLADDWQLFNEQLHAWAMCEKVAIAFQRTLEPQPTGLAGGAST